MSTRQRTIQAVAVYCGSSNRVAPQYLNAAEDVGRRLAQRGIKVIYGGGSVGLMGRVADGALAAGGEVIGVITRKLKSLEVGHTNLSEMLVVETMHQRKAKMAELCDAVIALPGGWGTFEELFEIITWTQLEYLEHPAGVLNVQGYYDRLLDFVNHAESEGFVRAEHRCLLQDATELSELLLKLETIRLPKLDGNRLTAEA